MKKLKAAKGGVLIAQPQGIRTKGYKKHVDRSEENFNEFICKILILNDGDNKLCLLEMNASCNEFSSFNEIREKIEKATDLKAGNIVIWTADEIFNPDAPGQIYYDNERAKSDVLSGSLTYEIVEEVKRTDNRYEEAVLKTGKYYVTDKQNINGHIDEELITLSVRGKDDELLALVVNYDCRLSLFESITEAQIVYREITTQIKKSVISSSAIEGKIRTVSEMVSLPLQGSSGNKSVLQGMAVHNFALLTLPGMADEAIVNKIKKHSPYANTMVAGLTGKIIDLDEGEMLVKLIDEKISVNLYKQSVKVMERKASDNKYLHKDFHISMNLLMKYIYDNYGEEALIKYLKQYSRAYYKVLNQKLRTGNKEALVEYFIDIYEKEGWPVNIISDEDSVEVTQDNCPGISHIVSKGWEPCPYYRETYNTVYKTLCEETPFEYILEYFNEDTGACKQRFIRKEVKP